MKYNGMECEACKKVFTAEDDVVCCPICGAPHHRACWFTSGHCASEHKHAEGYVWQTVAPVSSTAEIPAEDTMQDGRVKFPDGTQSVTCPHCGAENFPDDIYCRACHEQIKKDSLIDFFGKGDEQHGDNGDYYNNNNSDNDYYRQNMYNAYSTYGGIDPDTEIDGIPVKEYADYIGKNSGSYIRKFSIAEHFQKKTIWNWAAAIFGPMWFFARKQVKVGAILSAIIILLSALAGVLSMSEPMLAYVRAVTTAMQEYTAQYTSGELSYEDMLEKINAVTADASAQYSAAKQTPRDIAAIAIEYILISGSVVFSGLYGNYCYKTKVKKEILDSREKCTSAESYRAMLMSRGGISAGLAVIGALLQIVATVLITYMPIMYVYFGG